MKRILPFEVFHIILFFRLYSYVAAHRLACIMIPLLLWLESESATSELCPHIWMYKQPWSNENNLEIEMACMWQEWLCSQQPLVASWPSFGPSFVTVDQMSWHFLTSYHNGNGAVMSRERYDYCYFHTISALNWEWVILCLRKPCLYCGCGGWGGGAGHCFTACLVATTTWTKLSLGGADRGSTNTTENISDHIPSQFNALSQQLWRRMNKAWWWDVWHSWRYWCQARGRW